MIMRVQPPALTDIYSIGQWAAMARSAMVCLLLAWTSCFADRAAACC